LKSIRSRLTYANVMSTIAVFLVLGGATAFAASHLAKNSVGTKQLQKNAVTAAKIKNGAVIAGKIGAGAVGTGALADGAVNGSKIADGAVNGAKLSDGSVTAAKIGTGAVGTGKLGDGSVTANKLDPTVNLGSHVVQRLRGATTVNAVPGAAYPLDNPTYTQPAGEDDQYLAEYQLHFPPQCKEPRFATVELFLDGQLIGLGQADNEQEGDVTGSFSFRGVEVSAMARLAPASPTQRTFTMHFRNVGTGAVCNGGGNGMTITGAQVDVIGTR
jgi:hypothetical protein